MSTRTKNSPREKIIAAVRSGPEWLRKIEVDPDHSGFNEEDPARIRERIEADDCKGNVQMFASARIAAILLAGHRKLNEEKILDALHDAARYGLPARGTEPSVIAAAFYALAQILPTLKKDHPARTKCMQLIKCYQAWESTRVSECIHAQAALWAFEQIKAKGGK